MAAKRGRPPSAATRVRREFAAMLDEVGGGRFDFSTDEAALVELACALGQRIDLLQRMLAAESAKTAPEPAVVVRLASELRISEKELGQAFVRVRRSVEKTVAHTEAQARPQAPRLVRVSGHNGGKR